MLMPVSRKPATDLGILAHQFFSVIDIARIGVSTAVQEVDAHSQIYGGV